MSTPSLTLVATGTTSVYCTNPVDRLQQAVELRLAVADLERRVDRLTRRLAPPQVRPESLHRRAQSAWHPDL